MLNTLVSSEQIHFI